MHSALKLNFHITSIENESQSTYRLGYGLWAERTGDVLFELLFFSLSQINQLYGMDGGSRSLSLSLQKLKK